MAERRNRASPSRLISGQDVLEPGALKNRKSLNVALLGALATVLDLPEEHWLGAIHANLAPKLHKINDQAFALGRRSAEARGQNVA